MTCGTLFVMLFVYATGLIRSPTGSATGIVAATGAICLVYLVSFVLSLFGVNVPVHPRRDPDRHRLQPVVVGIAAFNLLLDFDFIEKGARSEAPKYMEWYGAFGLMVTLVWLYLEILRLLSQAPGSPLNRGGRPAMLDRAGLDNRARAPANRGAGPGFCDVGSPGLVPT